MREIPLPPEPRPWPLCPVCGEECRWIFTNHAGDAVGCDMCLDKIDSEIYEEEYA